MFTTPKNAHPPTSHLNRCVSAHRLYPSIHPHPTSSPLTPKRLQDTSAKQQTPQDFETPTYQPTTTITFATISPLTRCKTNPPAPMSLKQPATLGFGNTIQVEGNYKPQSAQRATGPSFNLKTLMAKFKRRRTVAPVQTPPVQPHSASPSTQPPPPPPSSSSPQNPPPPPPQTSPPPPARPRPTPHPTSNISPILRFRPKSIYEVLHPYPNANPNQYPNSNLDPNGSGGNGTKWGENDADGVGLPTGNGDGDMEGVWIRDFAVV